MRWQPLTVARRSPALTFGFAGGGFALLFVLIEPVQTLLAGRGFPMPPGLLWLFVVGGFLGSVLLAWLLWGRLDGSRSPHRGAAVGALVGLLALPVPFYLLELAYVAFRGNPFDPQPGTSTVTQLLTDLAALVAVPLFLGALGVIVTYGGTLVVGAIVGYVLAHD